ncbi:MAG: PAS domain S-box protein [Bacteroidota bacterium]
MSNSETESFFKLLFELSMSFGSTLELDDSILAFLEALQKIPNLKQPLILMHALDGKSQKPHFVYRTDTKNAVKPSDKSAVFQLLGKKQSLRICANAPEAAAVKHRKNIHSGEFQLWRLKKSGILQFYIPQGSLPFDEAAFRQLIKNFGSHLLLCKAQWIKDQQTKQQFERIALLNETNKRNNSILKSTGEGYILADSQMTITYANEQICRMSGYKEDEIVGYNVFDIMYNWEKTPEIREVIKSGIQGQMVEFEDWHIHKPSGRKWWALVKIRPFKDRRGNSIGSIATIIDITELKNARNKLESSEARYRALFENAFDGIIVFDGRKKRPVSCNKKILDYFKMSEKEFLSRTPLSLSPTYQPNGLRSDEYRAQILEELEKNGQVHYEWTHQLPDGTILHSEISSFQLPFHKTKHRTVLFRDITERKRALKELKEKEERLSLALEAGQLGTWDWNIETGETFYNDRWAEMLGYKLEEIKPVDVSFNDLVHPEDLAGVLEKIHEHLQGKTPFFELETRMIAKDNSIKWIYDLGKVTAYNRQGEPLRATGIHIDISRIKRTEQILKESEQRFRQLFEALQESEQNLREAQRMANVGSWGYDLTNGNIEWSEVIYSLFGFDPKESEPSYEDYIERIHPEDRPLLLRAIGNAIKKGDHYELNLRHYSKSGQLHYTIGRGKPIYEDGKVVKLVGTVQDITTEKMFEEAILETNRKYIDLFENMYDALIITDAEGRFLDANKAAQKMLGYTLEELIQLRIPDIVYPEDVEKSKKYLNQLIEQGYYSNYEGRIVTKNNEIRYLQVNSNAIYKKGEFAGSRDIVRDVTALKEAAQKREKLLQELEEVNKELKDFAYVVSHDLKAPLRAIGSLSQWIAEDYKDVLDHNGRHQLELLINRVNRMHNFIEGILEYSRIGRIQIAKEKVDLNALVAEIRENLDIPEHFCIEVQQPLPVIYAEKIRMNQLFQNLISNAIKYNDKEKGHLSICCTEKADAYQFAFADNGPGIEEKYHEKIFQIFQTLQARDKFESTGIGLTIVKRIVQHYGGKIDVHSVYGEGCTFEFSLKKY